MNYKTFGKLLFVALLCLAAFLISFYISGIKRKHNTEIAYDSILKIHNAEKKFKALQGRYGTLNELSSTKLINTEIANSIYAGYNYKLIAGDDSYTAIATPIEHLKTGLTPLYVDQTGVIRANFNNGLEATIKDYPIENQSDEVGD